MQLPTGIKYQVVNIQQGAFSPGQGQDPIISFTGKGANIEFNLVSAINSKISIKIKSRGLLTDDDIEQISEFSYQHIQQFVNEIGLKHFVKFHRDYPCYYDFNNLTLYEAYGKHESKGEINGQPLSLARRPLYRKIIEVLTASKHSSVGALNDDNSLKENMLDKFDQHWYTFRRLDKNAIKNTFTKNGSQLEYKGEPQSWIITTPEADESTITIEKLFKIIAFRRKAVATFNEMQTQIRAFNLDDFSADDMITILKIDQLFLDNKHIKAEQFIINNYCSDETILQKIFEKWSLLPAIWNKMKDTIREVFTLSFRVSSYYNETNLLPTDEKDLRWYPISQDRIDVQLNLICPSVKALIESTNAGIEFFHDCKREVNPESVINYIAALVLTAIYYCRTKNSIPKNLYLRQLYRDKLLELIRVNFSYVSPIDDREDTIEDLISSLQHLRTLGIMDEDAYQSYFEKVINSQKLLSYNDENSLIQTSHGMDH